MKKILLSTAILISFLSTAQVRLVKDCAPGGSHGSPIGFFEYNGRLFFAASPGGNGKSIWASDGTANGTQYISSNLGPLANPSAPGTVVYHCIFNGDLYLDAWHTNVSTYIYKMSGTSNTATIAVDLTGIENVNSARFFAPKVVNNKIVFSPYQCTTPGTNNPGVEPFYSDGTQLGTKVLSDINPGSLDSAPIIQTVFNNNLFFSAYGGTTIGRELYKTDGTPAGTALYLDLNAGAADSDPRYVNDIGVALTFVATHATLGRELFKTNGNGSLVLIKDINTTGDSNPTNVVHVGGGTLYFSADNGTVGQELWKSNGNSTGTSLVKDINPLGDSNASQFIQFGLDVYFTADDGTNGVELWKTDGTNAGTTLVKNINPTGSSNPNYLTVYNGKLYFTASDGTSGTELWVSDGTTNGTTMIEINPNGDSTISNLFVFNNELYFGADAGVGGFGKEVYAYMDPTLAIGHFSLNEEAITLSPNPSKNYFNLTTELTIEKVEVYSMLGQLVKTFEAQNQYSISELSKGSYIVKIATTEGVSNKTLLKE